HGLQNVINLLRSTPTEALVFAPISGQATSLVCRAPKRQLLWRIGPDLQVERNRLVRHVLLFITLTQPVVFAVRWGDAESMLGVLNRRIKAMGQVQRPSVCEVSILGERIELLCFAFFSKTLFYLAHRYQEHPVISVNTSVVWIQVDCCTELFCGPSPVPVP